MLRRRNALSDAFNEAGVDKGRVVHSEASKVGGSGKSL